MHFGGDSLVKLHASKKARNIADRVSSFGDVNRVGMAHDNAFGGRSLVALYVLELFRSDIQQRQLIVTGTNSKRQKGIKVWLGVPIKLTNAF